MKTISYRLLMPVMLIAGIFIFSQKLWAQADSLGFQYLEEAAQFFENREYSKSNQVALQAIEFFQEKEDWENWVRGYEILLDNVYYIGTPESFEAGTGYYEQALDFLTKHPDLPTKIKSRIWGNIGFISHDSGRYLKAQNYYQKAILLADKLEEDYYLLRLYTSLGSVIWFLGDDYRSIPYQEKALLLVDKLKATGARGHVLRELARAYQLVNPQKAIEIYRESLDTDPENSQTLMSISKAYVLVKDLDKAFATAQKAWKISQSDVEKSDAFHQLGRVYFAKDEYDKAIDYYQKAVPYGEAGYGKSSPECAKIYRFLGEGYFKKRDFKKALLAYNQTLDDLLPLFNPESEEDDPSSADLTNTSLWILESLEGKSQVYSARFKKTGKKTDREKALLLAEIRADYFQKVKSRFGEDESKYALNDDYFSACDFAMKTAFDLAESSGESGYLERAFTISNQNKAVVLNEALYRKEVKHLANIPDSLLILEKECHAEIVRCEKLLEKVENEKDLNLIKDSLFRAKRNLEDFEQQLESDFPVYANAKFQSISPKNIEQIRAELPENSALIEYFLGDSSIYTFLISKDNFWANEQPLLVDFDKSLNQFLRSVSDWKYVQDSSAQAAQDYLKTANFLYQILLKKPLELASENRVIIVPDGALGLVPFELFLTQPYDGNWTDRDVPFLIKERAISYRYSSNLDSKNQNESTIEWGGFGSEFKNLNPSDLESIQNPPDLLALRNEGQLPFADDEIMAIAGFFGGKSWLNEESTRKNFLQNAENYGILHLATHGIIDRQNPLRSRLLFSKSVVDEDPSVYAHEIYGMQLKAGLTVLSACNTGAGVWKRGEGIMSLARAFSFAGCPSVVMSLWSISDQSTADLMTDFYKNLQTEQPKDIALQNAKLEYLKTASAEYTKPIYWAGFVGIGDMDALEISRGWGGFGNWIWVLGLGVVLMGLIFIRRRF